MKKVLDLSKLVRPNILALDAYSSARDEYTAEGSKMIFLDANENPNQTGVNRYPDPHQKKLKIRLSEIKNISPDRILLGNGSDEVLDLIYRAFCEPGKDNIITLPPTYGMYDVLAGLNNIESREVLLTEDFQPNTVEILKNVDSNTKLIFLCSPNNPTGNSFSKDSITEILKKFEGLVILDEAYIDFSEQASWIEKLEKYPNLIITQTLSKAYGMAGIRLGICYASEEIIAILNKIKPPYNVNELTQNRAQYRLQNIPEVNREIADILNERVLLSKSLLEVKFIQNIYPSDANFLLVKVDDATKRYAQILSKGIVIRNRTKQPLCENTLRFTIGTEYENSKLIKVLKSLD